ncbi:MAG: hypothetical protein RLZZ52_580 [Actinomycetota bacterium]
MAWAVLFPPPTGWFSMVLCALTQGLNDLTPGPKPGGEVL